MPYTLIAAQCFASDKYPNNEIIYVPPFVKIQLGLNLPCTTLSPKYWQDSFCSNELLYHVATMPSFKKYQSEFTQRGIESVVLQRSVLSAGILFEVEESGVLIKNTLVHKAGEQLGMIPRRKAVLNHDGITTQIIDVYQLTESELDFYKEFPNAAIGDFIVSTTAIDLNRLGSINLSYSMPLTIEAFTRCAKVLTALVEQGFLSVPELNELRQQAMKSIVLEGFSAVSFKASPMPALKSELAIEPIDETRNRINFC